MWEIYAKGEFLIFKKHFVLFALAAAVNLFFVAPGYATDAKTKSARNGKKNFAAKKNAVNLPDRATAGKGGFRAASRAVIRSRLMLDKPLNKFTAEDKKHNRVNLKNLRRQPATQRFFSVIQEGEGGSPKIMVGNRCPQLTAKLDLSRHPGEVLPAKKCFYWYLNVKGKMVFSTASGNYQITRDNYRKIAPFLEINDFRVLSQQLIALELMRRGGEKTKSGLIDLARGDVRKAVCTGTQDWASSKCSTLEASRKQDYQKIYDWQTRRRKRQSAPETETKIEKIISTRSCRFNAMMGKKNTGFKTR